MSMPAEHMTSSPILADLLQDFAAAPVIPVHGIASDSRRLQRGDLFLAVQGMSSHGLDYLEQAKDAGVCAVAWDASTGTNPADIGVPTIAVDGLAEKLGVSVADLLRRGESVFNEATSLPDLADDASLADWIAAQPIVLERPIVVNIDTGEAVIGRPPENVLRLLS